MSHHPVGIQVDIVGTQAPNRGRSCEEHDVCGSVLALDAIVRLRAVEIVNDNNDYEAAIAAYWVTDGIDRCCVGYLPRDCVRRKAMYDGRLAQIVELCALSENSHDRRLSHRCKGLCRAALLE